jgi:hypothetical protein
MMLALISSEISADQNEVLIIGRPRESKTGIDTGRSVTITPQDLTSFESNSHFRSQSSMQVQETGSTSPSGFSLPRIRGHDYRLTRTSIEDVLIYDPDLNLPYSGEIDLRAFGRLKMSYGVPGMATNGISPIGSIDYELLPAQDPRTDLGIKLGDVYGQAMHGYVIRPKLGWLDSHDSELRIFARRHFATGDYPYYSDESTPYNSLDDQMRRRSNNQSQSTHLMPYARTSTAIGNFTLLSLLDTSERGLASSSAVIESNARERMDAQTVAIGFDRTKQNLQSGDANSTKFNLLLQLRNQTLHDPTSYFILLGNQSASQFRSWQLNGQRQIDIGPFFAGADATGGEALIDRSIDQTKRPRLSRKNAQIELRGGWKIGSLILGLKSNWKGIFDRSSLGADQLGIQPTQSKRRQIESQALLASYERGPVEFYFQWADSARAPSITEEFGDGATVLQSDGLEVETVRHIEAGASFHMNGGRLHWVVGLFKDQVKNKISLVPALSNSLRAINLRNAEIQGVEFGQQLRLGVVDWQLNLSRLVPIDTTSPSRRILPSTPQWQAATGIGLRLDQTSFKLNSTGRGRIYRDSANQIEIPEQIIHDLEANHQWKQTESIYRVGLSIRNLADTKSAAISATSQNNQHGRTALSDFAGAPLPGRSFLVYLESNFKK